MHAAACYRSERDVSKRLASRKEGKRLIRSLEKRIGEGSEIENQKENEISTAKLNHLVIGGRPDYLQKLKVPEGYEKMIDYSNI